MCSILKDHNSYSAIIIISKNKIKMKGKLAVSTAEAAPENQLSGIQN